MVKYRLSGNEYRNKLETETDRQLKNQLTARYNWLKERWFEGVQFKRGPALNASLTQDGVQCLPGECPTPAVTASLEVQLRVVPPDDTGRFHVRIDGSIHASNVGDGGTTGVLWLYTGPHTVSQSAATGTELPNYRTFIGGACAEDGRVELELSINKRCTITNVASEVGTQGCERQCRADRDECMRDPATRPQVCVALLNACLATCN
jgi:hypothetical protein